MCVPQCPSASVPDWLAGLPDDQLTPPGAVVACTPPACPWQVNNMRRYSLPQRVAVSDVFNKMEGSKAALGIREWALSMTTLEEVFILSVRED